MKKMIFLANDFNTEEYTIKVHMLLGLKSHKLVYSPLNQYPEVVKFCILYAKAYHLVFICKTGIGMSIVANKYPGIRAVVANKDTLIPSRSRNNCNVLCIGADYTSPQTAVEYIETFFQTKYEGKSNKNLALIKKIEEELNG